MWLRHFRKRRRTKHFQVFRERYYEYRAEDTDLLCRACHDEVTSLNWELINAYIQKHKLAACRTWTWAEAAALMAFLRKKYAIWRKTPRTSYPIKNLLHVPRLAIAQRKTQVKNAN